MRLILINTATGYIDGDTADFLAGVDWERTPQAAVQRLVSHIGDPETAQGIEYAVYRADINGSDAVPTVWDGQDRDTIRAVEESCERLGTYAMESWEAWEDGQTSRVTFLVPTHGDCDVAELGANALGVDVSESLNVQRVTQ